MNICPECGGTLHRCGQSVAPAPLLPNSGIASSSLLAYILNSKYTLALPLCRQEQELARIGVSISRQTMANWIIIEHERWFSVPAAF